MSGSMTPTHDILTTPAPDVHPVVRQYTEQQAQQIEELRSVRVNLSLSLSRSAKHYDCRTSQTSRFDAIPTFSSLSLLSSSLDAGRF